VNQVSGMRKHSEQASTAGPWRRRGPACEKVTEGETFKSLLKTKKQKVLRISNGSVELGAIDQQTTGDPDTWVNRQGTEENRQKEKSP